MSSDGNSQIADGEKYMTQAGEMETFIWCMSW